jgi:hypothetical protein
MKRMKVMLSFAVCLAILDLAQGQTSSFVNPTGTYILKGEVQKNRIVGHHGEIRVKLLNEHLVALCFYMNSGYPDYKSGAFTDTLSYEEDHVQYKADSATDCSIFIYFKPRSAELQQTFADPRTACGFEKGVIVSAFFKKYSSDSPVIKDLSFHGRNP